MTVEYGRRPIGVCQPPGGGDDYPIINPSFDIEQLLADGFLSYHDNANQLLLPFRIAWLFGFGGDFVSLPITPVHSHDVLIVDANDATVFDSLVATDFKSILWANRFRILEWTDANGQILRFVQHTEWSPEDTQRTYALYIEPVSGVLDPRVSLQTPRRVTSITVGSTTLTDPQIRFSNGYNTEFDIGDPEAVDGGRRTTTLTLNGEAGLGLGQYGPGCVSANEFILRINGVEPDEHGDLVLDALDCLSIERDVESVVQENPRQVIAIGNALRINNYCGPCCDCDDFIAVWEAMRKLRDEMAAMVLRAQAVRDRYHINRQRFIDTANCRQDNKLRLSLNTTCHKEIAVVAGYCNNSQDCLEHVVIHISFAYTDGTGSCPSIAAETDPDFDAEICGSTFRYGNLDPTADNTGGRQRTKRELYKLSGTYPHFWAYWRSIDPGSMGAVAFRLRFTDSLVVTTDDVEAIAEAFKIGGAPVEVDGSPVPGYVVGSGPLNTPVGMTLGSCPVFDTAPLSAVCC